MVELTNIPKQPGSQVLFLDASMKVNPGEKVGLVGANGAGKTTITSLLTRFYDVQQGSIFLIPQQVGSTDFGS